MCTDLGVFVGFSSPSRHVYTRPKDTSASLSRLKQGFDSPWERQAAIFPTVFAAHRIRRTSHGCVGWKRCGHGRERKLADRLAMFFKMMIVKLLRLFE